MAEDAFGIVGQVIASAYHVESVVAEGGFGTVYRAHHGGFRAPVALKCLRLPFGILPEAKQQFLESFRAEAELLFRLSASIPTVVRPLHVDAFTVPDGRFVPYMVLEWLEGQTLDAMIRARRDEGQPPMALKKAVRLLTPVARALERAHNFRGPEGPVSIVHRDIKPENIFVANVAGEEVVKVLDFGIGKAKSIVSQVAGRASQGAPGISTFTPAYGSPEQWAPKRYGQTGPWTDVWGLALTLTEALVGHPVIEGDPAAIMGTVLDPNRRPTPGSESVAVTPEVEQVFQKALALDPRERFTDAGVFWNELLAAARISSGETQEVRLPRDARAEPGGGTRVERVEIARRPSGRPPSGTLPMQHPPSRPTLDAPAALAAAPELQPLTAGTLPVAKSDSFVVPDLDLAPVSRRAPQRAGSGLRPAVAPPLELEEMPAEAPGGSLDLDLPGDDPIVRRASNAGMSAVRLPERAPSVPPTSQRSPGFGQPAHLSSPIPEPPVTPAPPPVEAPAARAFASPAPAAPPVAVPVAPERPAFRLKLTPDPDASLVERILPGAALLGAAIVVTILAQVYSAVTGEVLTIASLPVSVLAAVLMVVGIGLALFRLKRS